MESLIEYLLLFIINFLKFCPNDKVVNKIKLSVIKIFMMIFILNIQIIFKIKNSSSKI